jgi:hypothetical protein
MNVSRLRHMSAAEVAHRIREQFRRHADKVRFRAQLQVDDDPELEGLIEGNASSLKSYLRNGPARRFYTSTQDRERTASFIEHRYPEWLDRTIAKAGVLCEHRVSLFGRDVYLGDNIDWHRDPISGFQWQRRHWTEYDLVNMPLADAKVIHELNRHQHLPRLAKAFFLTDDERYASEAIVQIETWIEQNPKSYGVNWQSSLEIAIRSISWMWTIFLLLESQFLDEEKLRRICRSLFAQLDHVYRYPSVYTSPNTHLIGEAASLFIAGVLFPEIPRAESWRLFGERTLIDSAARQVLHDGVYGELSSYYHCYATDFYLHVLVLARANRISFPDWLWDGLSRMLEFVMHITRPDGTIPLFGDDDGGRVLALDSENYASYGDGLCSGSVLFGRPDFKHQSESFCEEALWLLGDEASHTFDSIKTERPAALHRAFEDAGYFVQRSGWHANDTHITFDCGGLGFGSGGHSHADALSFTVFSGGHEFLIDPGTSVYNGAPGWRRFFRSTAAHNTVVVDDRGQSEPGSSFRWKTRTSGYLRQQFALPGIDYIDGALEFRDGGKSWASILPLSRNGGITHRRRLVYIRPNYWIVLDNLDGRGEHDFDFLYHFAPNAQLTVVSDERHGEIDCRVGIDRAGLQMCMYASEAIRAEAICGQRTPIQGWASRIYREHHASPVLKASVHGNAPVSMMSFLCPGNEPLQSRRFKSNTARAIAASMRDEDYDDIAVMAADDGDLRLMDYVMRGEFFWMRLEKGNLRRLLAVNARSFSFAGEVVFESEQVIPYVHVYFWENGILIERGEQEGRVYVRDLRDRQFQRN